MSGEAVVARRRALFLAMRGRSSRDYFAFRNAVRCKLCGLRMFEVPLWPERGGEACVCEAEFDMRDFAAPAEGAMMVSGEREDG